MLDSFRFFKENYTDYTCSQTALMKTENRLGNLEVKAVPIGYKRAVPIDDLTILKATIKLRRGTLKGLYFKQMDPYMRITPATNLSDPQVKRALVFDKLAEKMDPRTGQVRERDLAVQEMKSSTFKYQSEKLVYHIMVKVENDKDDYGYDIFEFYANRNPVARELFLTSNDWYHNYTHRTVLNITTVNQGMTTAQKGWYDAEDDKYNKLTYQLHVASRTEQKFLISPSLPQQETFIVKIPHVAESETFTEVDFYVTATDQEGASSQKYITMNISNTYREESRAKMILELYQNLTGLVKSTYPNLIEVYKTQALLANLFEIGFRTPQVPTYTGVLCQYDEECNHGRCYGGVR
jgi:hypothetical protein